MHTTADLDECQARAMKIMGETKKQLERLGLEVTLIARSPSCAK